MVIDFVKTSERDWIYIYIDGSLEFQGHSIPPWYVTKLILMKNVDRVNDWEVDVEWAAPDVLPLLVPLDSEMTLISTTPDPDEEDD